MNKQHLFSCKAFIFFLVVFVAELKAETYTFGLSDNSPPYSSTLEETATGIIPSVINLAFELLPNDQAVLKGYPWARAQIMVESGQIDGLLTYPSKERKTYVLFTEQPTHYIDYGYLIYHRNNIHRATLEKAKSFDDLSAMQILVQTGVGWEQDSIPDSIEKIEVNSLERMIHLLLYRREGDFMFMPVEQAKYWAKTLGYKERVASRKVDFVYNGNTPFHFGIRKTHPQAERIIKELDLIIESDTFKQKVHEIVDKFRK